MAAQQTSDTLSPEDAFLFDLQGFLVIHRAIDSATLAAGNAALDRLQTLSPGCWSGHVQAHEYYERSGLNLQQIYEAGAAWESLIDHPAYIGRVRGFVGEDLFIDECFVNLRGPGEGIGLHSGAHSGASRTLYRVHGGGFRCSQVNVLIAWTDIGPGDGATMVVPASHKSAFPHPQWQERKRRRRPDEPESAEALLAAVEVHLSAGDALLFTDHLMHGSAARRNPGQRRISVYRYGPAWGRRRYPYQVSPGLLARLGPARRAIVEPQPEARIPPPSV